MFFLAPKTFNAMGNQIVLPKDFAPEFVDHERLITELEFKVNLLERYGYENIGSSSCQYGAYLKGDIVIKQMYTWRTPPDRRVPTRVIHRYDTDRYVVIQFFCERLSDAAYSEFYRSNKQLREDYDLQMCNIGKWRGEIVFFDW